MTHEIIQENGLFNQQNPIINRNDLKYIDQDYYEYVKYKDKNKDKITTEQRNGLNTTELKKRKVNGNITIYPTSSQLKDDIFYKNNNIFQDFSHNLGNYTIDFDVNEKDYDRITKDFYSFKYQAEKNTSNYDSSINNLVFNKNVTAPLEGLLNKNINGVNIDKTKLKIPNEVNKLVKKNKDISLPNTIEEIDLNRVSELGENLFMNSNIRIVKIPDGITKIPNYTFYKCRLLKDIILPDGLKEIGDNSFSESGLNYINIPGTVYKIGLKAFYLCDQLTEVAFESENEIKQIEGGCFSGCSSLEYLSNFKNTNITTIEGYTFSGCKSLEKIKLPTSLKSIMDLAFNDSSIINFISPPNCTISNGIKEEYSMFNNCFNMKSLIIEGFQNDINVNLVKLLNNTNLNYSYIYLEVTYVPNEIRNYINIIDMVSRNGIKIKGFIKNIKQSDLNEIKEDIKSKNTSEIKGIREFKCIDVFLNIPIIKERIVNENRQYRTVLNRNGNRQNENISNNQNTFQIDDFNGINERNENDLRDNNEDNLKNDLKDDLKIEFMDENDNLSHFPKQDDSKNILLGRNESNIDKRNRELQMIRRQRRDRSIELNERLNINSNSNSNSEHSSVIDAIPPNRNLNLNENLNNNLDNNLNENNLVFVTRNEMERMLNDQNNQFNQFIPINQMNQINQMTYFNPINEMFNQNELQLNGFVLSYDQNGIPCYINIYTGQIIYQF